MNFPPDLVEKKISNTNQAWELLDNKLPQFRTLLNKWQVWHNRINDDSVMQQMVIDAIIISYARMSLRNGSLSTNPRSYHSEKHIDDLFHRLMLVSELSESKSIPGYGWSLLSLFMSCHDLRQSEDNDFQLIGNNEQASYQEILRLLNQLDTHNILCQEHKELLQLMIHGSTFGKGEDISGNIYQGNLVKYLLQDVTNFDTTDKELAYLACDIDTANVATDLKDYAQSSVDVYHEIQNLSPTEISAHAFFGEKQEQYFFELQKFNSKLGFLAFAEKKSKNAPQIKKICGLIKQLDKNLKNSKIVEYYRFHMALQT